MTKADLRSFQSNSAALPRTTALFREPGLRTLLLHLNAGECIPEHQTRGALLVNCLAGEGVFSVADEQAELRPGTVISVSPSRPHSVAAAESQDLLLLVTISEQTATEQ